MHPSFFLYILLIGGCSLGLSCGSLEDLDRIPLHEDPRCAVVHGPFQEEDTVLLASILPHGSAQARSMAKAVGVAVQEINEAGGIAGGKKLTHLSCDSGRDPQQAVEIAQNLLERHQPALILGPAYSSAFINVTTLVTAPANVLTITPSASSALISDLQDKNLAWRTVPSDLEQGLALSALLRHTFPNRETPRVFALAKGDSYGTSLLETLSKNIGPSLGDHFEARVYQDPLQPTDLLSSPAELMQDIKDFRPDLIYILGTIETSEVLAHCIESYDTDEPRPLFLLSEGGHSASLLSLLEKHPDWAPKIQGTQPDLIHGAAYQDFARRLYQRTGEPPQLFASTAYDATYLAALAISASPTTKGSDLARQMPRMIQGEKILVGPDHLGHALKILDRGGSIDLEGASGSLDFDLDTGDVSGRVLLWNVQIDGSSASFAEEAYFGGDQWKNL